MIEKKEPHERMTEKNNGLTSAQEVLYSEEFKRADNATKGEKNEGNKVNKDNKQ